MPYFRFSLLILGGLILLPQIAAANSVGDLYNMVRLQMMKNEELTEYVSHKRYNSAKIKAAACSWKDYPTAVDKDWALDVDDECKFKADSDFIQMTEQFALIREQLGLPISISEDERRKKVEAEKLKALGKAPAGKAASGNPRMHDWEDEDPLRSIAVTHIDCLTGELDFCKEKITQIDYLPLLPKTLADIEITRTSSETKKQVKYQALSHLFSRPVEEVEDEFGNVHVKPSLAVKDAIDYTTSTCVDTGSCTDMAGWDLILAWIENNLTTNVSSRESFNSSSVTYSLARHLSLAQGYGIAQAARRAAEDIDEFGQDVLLSMVNAESADGKVATQLKEDKYEEPAIMPRNLRENIHLLIAIDAQIIHQLGHINAIQSAIMEVKAGGEIRKGKTFGAGS